MGLRSACPISRALMDFWAGEVSQIEERSKTLALVNPVRFEPCQSYLMTKYVDDVLKMLEEMRRGTRWDPNHKTFIWSQDNFEADYGRNLEEMTMEQVSAMASSILNVSTLHGTPQVSILVMKCLYLTQ